MGLPKPERFKIGDRVVARESGWVGTIVSRNKQRSSPWKVQWDKNGRKSNVNLMVVRKFDESVDGKDEGQDGKTSKQIRGKV